MSRLRGMDPVDRLLGQWARERPDLDTSPMGVVGRISRVARRIDAAQRETFARFDLDPAGFDVLATLRRSGPGYALTPGELMRTAMVTSGALSQRLDRLRGRALGHPAPHPPHRPAGPRGLTPPRPPPPRPGPPPPPPPPA